MSHRNLSENSSIPSIMSVIMESDADDDSFFSATDGDRCSSYSHDSQEEDDAAAVPPAVPPAAPSTTPIGMDGCSPCSHDSQEEEGDAAAVPSAAPVSYTHLTLPTTPYV